MSAQMKDRWMVHVHVESARRYTTRGYTKYHPSLGEALADAKKQALAWAKPAYVLKVVGGFGVEVFPLQVERNTDYLWFCKHCRQYIEPHTVTFDQRHDPRCGGCGHEVEPTR